MRVPVWFDISEPARGESTMPMSSPTALVTTSWLIVAFGEMERS